jgi:cytochrome c553
MRRITLFLAAAAFVVAIPVSATPAIMSKAKADDKKGEIKNCASCHIGTPKDKKFTDLGKKFVTKK